MTFCRGCSVAVLALGLLVGHDAAAERFYISIPGPTLSNVPLYYGQEKIFDFSLATEAAR